MTDLTRQLQGKEIVGVYANGITLLVRTRDGAEIAVQWVNENGDPIKGRPVVSKKGFRLNARGLNDLIYLPNQKSAEGRQHRQLFENSGLR